MDIIAKDPIFFIASIILIPHMIWGLYVARKKHPTSVGLIFYVIGELIVSYFLIRGTVNPIYGNHPFYHNYYGLWVIGLTWIAVGQKFFAAESKEDYGFWENNRGIILAIIANLCLLVTYLYEGY